MGHNNHILITLFLFLALNLSADQVAIPRLKYSGGGDWYNGKTEIPNLLMRFKKEFKVDVNTRDFFVTPDSKEIFNYPIVFVTGHGKISFSNIERNNLRKYCENGGLLYIDDDYGMDEYIRYELKKIFPSKELIALSSDFELFHIRYKFKKGIPQIHTHYEKPPVAYGIFDDDGNLIVLYTYNTNISDGWDSKGVHPEDSNENRELAIKMGINILLYALLY